MNEGFLPLKRGLTDYCWFTHQNRNVALLMLLLLEKACYKPSSWCGQKLNRGQLVIGIGSDKTPGKFIQSLESLGLSVKQIRYALDTLQKLGEISLEGKQGCFTIVTITYFNDYVAAFNEGKAEQKSEATVNVPEPEVDNGYIDWGKVPDP